MATPGCATNCLAASSYSNSRQLFIPLNVNSARDQILKWMPNCNAHGVTNDWRLTTFDEELQWSSTLVEKATRAEEGMYKRTTSVEVAYILKRVAVDMDARRIEMEKAAKAMKGKGKGGDGSSSQGGSEAQAIVDSAREEFARDSFAGLDALATAAKELQEGEEGECGRGP